ncbi:hypothetical protein [Haloarcula regularis]|uniref:hypothetical protein n=1 Tax=Haloarcula regularis TaxID=3033392 RepID=UPI0023E8D423|nr:hypothetical protein [Halomicroarcula sp. SYNS111]
MPLTDQTVVRGDTIELVPITRAFDVGGTQTVAVEPRAGLLDRTQVSDVRVTLPTELSERRWETLLDGEVPPGDVTVSGPTGSRTLELTLDGDYTLACGPVGIGEVPPSGERGGGIDDINPAAPGEIRLTDEFKNGQELTLEFQNSGDDNSFIEARINFFEAQGGSSPSQAVIREEGATDSGTLQVRGDFVQLDPDLDLEGDDATTRIVLDFDQNLNSNDWLVVSMQLETGETALYFIPVP